MPELRFDAVIFDLDGTLADTLDDIADAMNEALRRLSQPTHARETYKRLVGEASRTWRATRCRKAARTW